MHIKLAFNINSFGNSMSYRRKTVIKKDQEIILPDEWPQTITRNKDVDFFCNSAVFFSKEFHRVVIFSSNQYFLTGIRDLLELEVLSTFSICHDFHSLSHQIINQNKDGVIISIEKHQDLIGAYGFMLKLKQIGNRCRVMVICSRMMTSDFRRVFYSWKGIITVTSSMALNKLKTNTLIKHLYEGNHATFSAPELSLKQLQVIRLVAQGTTIEHIASKFNMSIKAVYAHKNRALKKLGAENKALECVLYSILNKDSI